jgi:LysR family hydrogen peroxide-inducible transcriptional activator
MTIQQLEYIAALDLHRHFVKAANHCFVTQPTLTMQVQKLEEEIGITLFDRSKKPLQPTESGVAIIAKIKSILLEINQLKDHVFHEKETIDGTYTIGIIPTIAPYLLPLFLANFVKEHPTTKLNLKELQTHQIIDELKKGTLDIGILATPLEENSIREIPLYYEPFVAYTSEKFPFKNKTAIKADELKTENLLLLEEGHCFRAQALQICQHPTNQEQTFAFQSGSIEALKGLVKSGLGYTLIPELAIQENDNENIHRFESPEPSREISLVCHKGFAKELLLEKIAESIKANLPTSLSQTQKTRRITWK